ncbi:arginase [Seinonella peptonophila]|uniref:Arginase n=1 Tax=Seinonella peptonophila TaxID=112248 RepID=A0A1M4YE45_9BACL|nr:arginase [Seinonella peptonophila]SHF04104.1 arginase [Seinonella peptonophila]
MSQKKVTIIGVPMHLGQNRRGVDMGPSAIRYAKVRQRIEQLGFYVEDLGDIYVPSPERLTIENPKLKWLPQVKEVNEKLADQVSKAIQQGSFPLVLGGDHSIAIGTLTGVTRQYQEVGLIWFDAHGDLNTEESSPSGNIHGMSLAVSLGIGHSDLVNMGNFSPKIKPDRTVIVGARDLDPPEKTRIHELGIRVFTMHEIDRVGMAAVMEEAIQIASQGTKGIHLSFDLDGLDPKDAPGVGTPVLGGTTYRESQLAMEMLAESKQLLSAEFVEVNPILDQANHTAKVAVELIESILGKKIL